jgi:hypothetical protein
MAVDEIRPEEPEPTERGWVRTVLIMALPLAAVWAAAFWITGLLWWDAGDAVEQLPPPDPPQIESVESETIDLDRYTRAHPMWQP